MRVDGNVMPSLDAFDEEFGRERSDIGPPSKTPFRLSTVIGLALAAGVISALALGWPNLSGALWPDSEQAFSETPEAAIRRLTREVEELRQSNSELAQAQQQAAVTIAALQAGEQEGSVASAFWYSDVRALTYRNPFQPDAALAAANGQRSANARPKPREAQRRDDGGPVSLEAPQ